MTSTNIPFYLSEVNPEEHAFILLKRTRAAKKRVQHRTEPSYVSMLRIKQAIIDFKPQPLSPTLTFMRQLDIAARRGELING